MARSKTYRARALAENPHECAACGKVLPPSKLEADHVQALVDNGPDDWLQLLCHDCHVEKTNRDAAARKRRGQGASMSTVVRWVVGGALLAVAWWWWETGGVQVDKQMHVSTPDPATLLPYIIAMAVAVAVVLVVGVGWRRRSAANQRMATMLAKHTNTRPEQIRVSTMPFTSGQYGRCSYTSHFDDAAGSKKRADFETLVTHKTGGRPLAFVWHPASDRVTWRPDDGHSDPQPVAAEPADVPVGDMVWNPAAASTDTWHIPIGQDVRPGHEVVWDLRKYPHALIVGPTGTGKTVLLRTTITSACARGFVVLGVDPKRIELTGLRTWPGVRAVASQIEDIIALVDMVAEEMDQRYDRIESGLVDEDDLDPVLLVVDEATEFIKRANVYWKANKPKGATGSEHPVVERLRSMARLGRSARIHIVMGIQRPDANVVGGEARDNFGFRAALGSLSQDGAKMVFGRADVGVDVPEVKGRATVGMGESTFVLTQTYYTPNPRKCTPQEKTYLAGLAAAAGAGSTAVGHINADTIRARGGGEPVSVKPVISDTRPVPVAVNAPVWDTVDVDDLAGRLAGSDDGQWVRLDDGTEWQVLAVNETDRDGEYDVDLVDADGAPMSVFADDSTTWACRSSTSAKHGVR